MLMRIRIHALLALLLATLPALAAHGQESRLRAELAGTPVAAPGSTVELEIRLSIAAGWHIQAGQGSGDERPPYIASNVKAELPAGWRQGRVQWPAAHMFTLGFGQFAETLAGYDGDAVVRVPVSIPASAEAREHAVRIQIDYQACDDSVCEMPTSLTIAGAIAVEGEAVEGGARTATPPAGLDLVAAGDDADGDLVLTGTVAWYEGELTAGSAATLGVVLQTHGKWHVQAGQGSGDEVEPYIPTVVQVDLPAGWIAGETLWPPAHDFQFGEGEYAETLRGYEGRFVIAVPVQVPLDADLAVAPAISVQVDYQACDDAVCLAPETLELEGSTVAGVIDDDVAALFAETLSRAPVAAAPGTEAGGAEFDLSSSKWWGSLAFVWAGCLWMVYRTMRITRRPGPIVATSLVAAVLMYGMFAFTSAITAPSKFEWIHYDHAAFEAQQARGKTVLIKFTADWCPNCLVNERLIMADDDTVAALSSPDVAAMKVDFTAPDAEGQERLNALGGGGIPVIAVFPAGGADPIVIRGSLATTSPVTDALQGIGVAESADSVVFDVAGWRFSLGREAVVIVIVFAFIAGFLMNFTPCVLPVIPLKILSLQAHAKDPKRCFALGISFCLGIMAVYAILGALIAGFVAGVESFGWGDQFQKWWLNALIGLVVGAMGFGMLGLFVIQLPKAVYMFNPQSDSHGGSVAMGAFTAILSTPCTGPLLGGVLAWMATQPALLGFSTLMVMGAGMAAPYLLLTARPQWLDRLPRTGPGSELIKQVMGLLMMAVAVYFLGTALVALGV